jgi:uncharacterized protein (DUF433 family)
MTLVIEDEKVPIYADERGVFRINNTRVLLDLVVSSFLRGSSPEDIIEQYTTLDLANVYSVIGYYLRHKEEIDAYIAERDAQAQAFRLEMEAKYPTTATLEKIKARYNQRNANQITQ